MCDNMDIPGTPEFDALYFDDDVAMSKAMSYPNKTIYDGLNTDSDGSNSDDSSSGDDN